MTTFTLILWGTFYFLPSIYAAINKKKHTEAICVLNFFLGWTVIGWVAALVWASADSK